MSVAFETVTAAARRLGVHPKTVLRFIHEGRLAATRIGKSYRILTADLEAFAGLPAAAAPAERPMDRVTAIAELAELSPDMAARIANALQGAAMSRGAGAGPLRLDTAYDPLRREMKVVIFAAPRETAAALQVLQAVMDAVR